MTGHVQGVFFRSNIKDFADSTGLVGYAKNQPDGSVEVVAEGSDNVLNRLIDVLWEGTHRSNVENVAVRWREATGGFDEFQTK